MDWLLLGMPSALQAASSAKSDIDAETLVRLQKIP